MSYDFTPPNVVNRILTPGQTLDINLEQAFDAIKQLAGALKAERSAHAAAAEALVAESSRHEALVRDHRKAMSDLEMRMMSLARPPQKPKYTDGVRHAPPQGHTPLGPDGFPQRGII
jgi:hypothetical protein